MSAVMFRLSHADLSGVLGHEWVQVPRVWLKTELDAISANKTHLWLVVASLTSVIRALDEQCALAHDLELLAEELLRQGDVVLNRVPVYRQQMVSVEEDSFSDAVLLHLKRTYHQASRRSYFLWTYSLDAYPVDDVVWRLHAVRLDRYGELALRMGREEVCEEVVEAIETPSDSSGCQLSVANRVRSRETHQEQVDLRA